jgi:sugar transferase (PEP-CTERM/EpsH1 system associated)
MRICFLTPRFPYPPLKGDTLRVYHQIRALSAGHQVTLLSLAEAPVSEADYQEVASFCERIEVVALPKWRAALNLGAGIVSAQPLQVHYYRAAAVADHLRALLAGGAYDVIHATLIRMLPYVWNIHRPPVVVDLIDSLSLNLADRRTQVRGPKRLGYELEYGRVQAYERAVVRHFPALVLSSPADKEALGGGDQITVIPNGVDIERFPFHGPAGRDPATLVFTGNMGYHPNEEAVVWFAAEVWPRLRAARPGVRFQVVGTNPTERVRALAGDGIEVLGRVPDVTTYLHAATVAVCPMRSGSGIQNKVLEAMACGAPVVATAIANRGVQGEPERDLLVADSAEAFAAAVLRLLDAPETAARLAQAGRPFVEQTFRWESHAARLTAIYAAQQAAGKEGRYVNT